MNPQVKKEIEDLKKRLSSLEQNKNRSATQSILKDFVIGGVDVAEEDITHNTNYTVTIGEGGGSDSIIVTTVDTPTKFLKVKFQGRVYKLPAYDI